MTDFQIQKADYGWDLVMEDGDLVLQTDPVQLVIQRVIYRLCTWFQESPYDRSVGLPYAEGIFGMEPVETVVFIFTQEIAETEGVNEVVGTPTYLLDPGRSLEINAVLRISGNEVSLSVSIPSSLAA